MADLETFRAEVRTWLEQNCPVSMREPIRDPGDRVWASSRMHFPNEDARLWFERMRDRRWFAPEWPEEYGGGGLSPEEGRVLREEMQSLNCRTPQYSYGITMIGPVLLEFGTEEQKREFLPQIARGELRWCQGYSEPGAGSDLAGLRTAAEDRGDHYIVNGSKVWTSDADKADWIYCLVRTDPDAPKQAGISFLLFSMHQPGITVKPIRLINGLSHFCEVFFDDVRAEKRHRISEENHGWTVAKRLLMHERAMMADLSREAQNPIVPLEVARDSLEWEKGRIADEYMRLRLAQNLVDRRCMELTNLRAQLEIEAGSPSRTPLMLKYAGTELETRDKNLMMEMAGSAALGWEGEESFTPRNLQLVRDWLFARAHTIAGGSSEIQLNIIARRGLDLPRT